MARRFVACPVRTAGEVWKEITAICSAGSMAASHFNSVAGIAASLIGDEELKDHPLILKGEGPRVRVYCLYDDNAIEGDDKNEDSLSSTPCSGEWTAFLPCKKSELAIMQELLKGKSAHFKLYDPAVGLPDEAGEEKRSDKAGLSINLAALKDL